MRQQVAAPHRGSVASTADVFGVPAVAGHYLRVCRSNDRSLSLPSGGLTTRKRLERVLPSARKLHLRDSDLDHGDGTKAID